jgi:hypothetical protein
MVIWILTEQCSLAQRSDSLSLSAMMSHESDEFSSFSTMRPPNRPPKSGCIRGEGRVCDPVRAERLVAPPLRPSANRPRVDVGARHVAPGEVPPRVDDRHPRAVRDRDAVVDRVVVDTARLRCPEDGGTRRRSALDNVAPIGARTGDPIVQGGIALRSSAKPEEGAVRARSRRNIVVAGTGARHSTAKPRHHLIR